MNESLRGEEERIGSRDTLVSVNIMYACWLDVKMIRICIELSFPLVAGSLVFGRPHLGFCSLVK